MSLELLYNYEKQHIRRAEDAVVCTLHCYLISNGFKCVGNNEEIPSHNVRKSDMLPDGWSDGAGVYTLMYQRDIGSDSANYLLKVIDVGGTLLVHMLRMSDEKVVDMEIKTSEYIGTSLSSFESAYRKLDELERRFKTNILETLTSAPSPRNIEQPSRTRTDPLREPPLRPQPSPNYWTPPRDPFSIGRSDLDPFCGSGVGGGMVYDPMRPGGGGLPDFGRGGPGIRDPSGFPRGSTVPGARFDPVYPPGFDPSGNTRPDPRAPDARRMNPDPDHERPPGWDDMYM